MWILRSYMCFMSSNFYSPRVRLENFLHVRWSVEHINLTLDKEETFHVFINSWDTFHIANWFCDGITNFFKRGLVVASPQQSTFQRLGRLIKTFQPLLIINMWFARSKNQTQDVQYIHVWVNLLLQPLDHVCVVRLGLFPHNLKKLLAHF